MSDIQTFPTGWCFTCDTNECEHVVRLNLSARLEFEKMLRTIKGMSPKVELPGLTGEPWRKYPHD